MAIAISLDDTYEYVLPEEKENPDKTIWIIGSIPGRIMHKLLLSIRQSNGDIQVEHETTMETVRHGLKGWKNFKNAKGDQKEFQKEKLFCYGKDREVLKDSLLDEINPDALSKLAFQMLSSNQLSEQERKN